MRKGFSGILATVIILSVCATTAFAAGPGGGHHFVDADRDGICDNSGSACIYADADWDGVCDVCGANHGSCLTGEGKAFVDANGDGICDNCGTYHWCSVAGVGCGKNFVDADGDGVCDNYASRQGRGGHGYGFQSGCGNGFRGGHCR